MGLATSFVRKLQRRKRVDAAGRPFHQLPKNLSVIDMVTIGVGSTIGAGVYVLVGTVAKERTGPALCISFLIAGIAATLSAFCYAELASRCPSAGSAYHYSYLCVGEGVAWLIGWALILEYTVGGSAVARGISPNLALLIGEDNIPSWLSRTTIPGTEIIVDPCAGLLVILVTILLCAGVKESATVQSIITSLNILVLIFVIAAGSAIGFKTNWIGYRLADGYLPFGVNGLFGGAATLFFSYIGFDTVASTAEEVKNPQKDLPLGIGIALSICACLYMLVSVVIVGIVPYDEMDSNTPIPAAFSRYGVDWAMYIVSAGAVAALFSTLMGSLLPQPRILMAMARDGLLPGFFLNISKRTWIPVNGTLTTGFIASVMAFFMDVDQLSGMVSVGTLLAFAIVGVSILILRYVSPAEVPIFPSSYLSPSTSNASPTLFQYDVSLPSPQNVSQSITVPSTNEEKQQLLSQRLSDEPESKRRLAAIISISVCVIGSVFIAGGACGALLPSWLRWSMGSLGTCLFITGGIILILLDQDEGRHTFGRSGGFLCPFVPWLPLFSILINVYLLADLGLPTWLRVGIWLLIGILIYMSYGINHSLLSDEKRTSSSEEASVISTVTA